MPQKIKVGMAQMSLAERGDQIETQALGSCVAIILYDPYAKIGGMAHPMLPDIYCAKESSRSNKAKFVNTAAEELLKVMIQRGAQKKFIKAKLAGGANMFPDITREDSDNIGWRNVEAARQKLRELEIVVAAEDVGGHMGRTVVLDVETGILKVRMMTRGEKEI